MSRPSLPVNEAIELRRSTKDFNDTPIDPEVLEEILRLTVAAPSSWNLQPWRIVVIDQAEDREKLHAACFNQRQVLEAPVTLVFAVDHQAWKDDMEQIIEQARECDAWPDNYCEIARQAIPGGQTALEKAGLLREYAVKDAMIAATHSVLAATGMGLKTTFMNGWMEPAVKEVIGAGDREEISIAVLVTLGHADEVLPNPGRLPAEKTVYRHRLA